MKYDQLADQLAELVELMRLLDHFEDTKEDQENKRVRVHQISEQLEDVLNSMRVSIELS